MAVLSSGKKVGSGSVSLSLSGNANALSQKGSSSSITSTASSAVVVSGSKSSAGVVSLVVNSLLTARGPQKQKVATNRRKLGSVMRTVFG